MDNTEKKQRGGKREGSGRPSLGMDRKRRSIFVNDEEFKKVKAYIAKIKKA